jgi:hypothetical protein
MPGPDAHDPAPAPAMSSRRRRRDLIGATDDDIALANGEVIADLEDNLVRRSVLAENEAAPHFGSMTARWGLDRIGAQLRRGCGGILTGRHQDGEHAERKPAARRDPLRSCGVEPPMLGRTGEHHVRFCMRSPH